MSSYNSRGGRMFQKQKKRMDECILNTPANQQNHPIYQPENMPIENRHASQPREYRRHTPAGSKNMPALINNTMNTKSKSKMSGPVIRPLKSPPPEWKAKVDAGYRYHSTPQYAAKRWIQENYGGYESAPPEELIYEDAEFTNNYVGEGETKGPYARSFHGSRSESRGEGPETAAFYFNAKYHARPHYFAKPHIRRDAFVTTPYAVNDFNARAVGWSKAYVQQY